MDSKIFYNVEGLGKIDIDPKHLPMTMDYIFEIKYLDLYIVKIWSDPHIWLQKNYKSNKFRIILPSIAVDDKDNLAYTNYMVEPITEQDFQEIQTSIPYRRALFLLQRAPEILELQNKLLEIHNNCTNLVKK